jgi:outer membrane protein OmpA-like peptidoglycan-associated protein
MNRKTHIAGILFTALAAVLVFGCASTTPQLSNVDSARSAYKKIADDKEIKQYAPVQLYQAEQQYHKLNDAVSRYADKEEVDHLAYVLQQRVELARMTAQHQMATNQINQINKEQAQIKSDLQTAESQYAKERAEQAALEAKQAQERANLLVQQAQQTSSLEQQMKQIKSASVSEQDRGIVLTLEHMFDFGKATLKSDAEQNLNSLAQVLKQNPDRNVIIEGYTDSTGPAPYNEQLSRERARAVVSYLVSQGINRERLTAKGYGESYPIASNENAAGRQRNRRVDVVVLRAGQQPQTAFRPQATPSEMSTFSELDKDKNGYLSKDETQPMQGLNDNFNQYDQNQDKQLSRSEFSAFEEKQIQQQKTPQHQTTQSQSKEQPQATQ